MALVPVKNFLESVMSCDGIAYIFGGKDPHKDGGLDCSGLVAYALKLAGGPDYTQTHNAARLYCETIHAEPSEVVPGCLAFYGPPGGPATHVMVVVDGGPLTGLQAYGACGGNRDTLTVEIANKQSAKVQHRKSVRYRYDLIKTGRWIRLAY